jgi:hypothetical protein
MFYSEDMLPRDTYFRKNNYSEASGKFADVSKLTIIRLFKTLLFWYSQAGYGAAVAL